MIETINPLTLSHAISGSIKKNFHLIGLWFFFRIFTSVTVAVASSIKPLTELEQKIALWPPTLPINMWLERVFISPWVRWDVIWYLKIISNGYSANDGTANFHPLYPWLGKLLTTLNLHPVFSLLLISSSASILTLIFLKKLIIIDTDHGDNNLPLMIFLLFPTSFILFAPYPESLFLLFSIICINYLRKKKWVFAGFSAFFAVLTRQQGLFLIFPFIWELWETSDRKVRNVRRMWRNWLTVGIIPVAYLFWIVYRYYILGDNGIKVGNLQEIIYSIFISSSATIVVPDQQFILPWHTIIQAYMKIVHSPDLDIWINVILALLFVWMLIVGWKKMGITYRIYSSIIYLVSFSYFTGPLHPLMGLPRHLSLAFPIYGSITGPLVKRMTLILLYIFLCILLMSIIMTAYTLVAWVP